MSWGAVAGAVVGGVMANKAAKRSASGQEHAAQLAYEQSLPWSTTGMFGGAKFDEEGRTADITLSPEMKAIYDRMLTRSGKYGEQVSTLDPKELQEQYYQESKAMAEPGEARERLALENRLRAQGMLGATGGAMRSQALLESQQMKDLARRAEAQSASQAQLERVRAREAADLGTALQLGALPMDYATLGRGIGTGMSGAAATGAGLRSQAALGIGGTQAAFWGNLGQKVGSADWSNVFSGGSSTPPGTAGYSGPYTGKDYSSIFSGGPGYTMNSGVGVWNPE